MGMSLKRYSIKPHYEGLVIEHELRGKWIENVHFGHVAVVSADGRLLAWTGDPGMMSFMRSTAKPIQAIPGIVNGQLAQVGFGDEELALMAGSHESEEAQIAVLERMLKLGGVAESDLAMPPVYPFALEARDRLMRSRAAPRPIYHACAGKHIGSLALCRLNGWPLEGYTQPDHPLQEQMLCRVAEFAGIGESAIGLAVDGCGFPVFALPLWRLALAYARLAAPPAGWGDDRLRGAAAQVTAAMNRQPALVEGTGRLASVLLGDANIVAKSGAQGVFAFALRQQRLGVAVKVMDGNEQALPAAVAAILESLAAHGQMLPPAAGESAGAAGDAAQLIRDSFPAELRNEAGTVVGRREAVVRLVYGGGFAREDRFVR